jgi:hypothetical protein
VIIHNLYRSLVLSALLAKTDAGPYRGAREWTLGSHELSGAAGLHFSGVRHFSLTYRFDPSSARPVASWEFHGVTSDRRGFSLGLDLRASPITQDASAGLGASLIGIDVNGWSFSFSAQDLATATTSGLEGQVGIANGNEGHGGAGPIIP